MNSKLLAFVATIALSIALAGVSNAQELITKTPIQQRAEAVSEAIPQTINYLEFRLASFYNAATVKGEEQAFFDVYGTNAAKAVQWYAEARAFVIKFKPDSRLPEPNPAVFVVNADGTVTYVEPPEPVNPFAPAE